MGINQNIFRLLVALTGKKIIFPFYHCVSDKPAPFITPFYKVKTKKEFKKDLDWLLKHYAPLSIEELVRVQNKNTLASKKYFHLSFDDGLQECYSVIYPILREKGIPASFFINTAFIDNKDMFYRYKIAYIIERISSHGPSAGERDKMAKILGLSSSNTIEIKETIKKISYSDRYLLEEIAKTLDFSFHDIIKNYKPYMAREQIYTLARDGFTIGGHSVDHPRFEKLQRAEQVAQVKKCMDYIEQNFEQKYRAFSFPFTDHLLSRALYENLYQVNSPVLDVSFGTSGMKDDTIQNNYQRIAMDTGTNKIANKMTWLYLKYFVQRLLWIQKLRRK